MTHLDTLICNSAHVVKPVKLTPMGKALLATLASLFLLGSAAQADDTTFEQAFTYICLDSLPDLNTAPAKFEADGWQGYAGAGPGEYEFYKSGTSVFLTTGKSGLQPGCTVKDPSPVRIQALWLMELWLDKRHEGNWQQGTDQYGVVWRLLLAEGTVVFHLEDDPNGEGGAAISFELRP